MNRQRLRDLIADAYHWIQRSHRLLKNHRDIFATQTAQMICVGLQQIFSIVDNRTLRRNQRRFLRQQTHDRHGANGFAAAGFTDQRNRTVDGNVEADTFYRVKKKMAIDAKLDAQIVYAEQGIILI